MERSFSGRSWDVVDVVIPARIAVTSSSLTSRQEHLACFFVQPTQAVRFLRQSMWRRRQRSQGGITRSPRWSSSIRAIISSLKGPPSSFYLWNDIGGGRRDDGVFGMATVVAVAVAVAAVVVVGVAVAVAVVVAGL